MRVPTPRRPETRGVPPCPPPTGPTVLEDMARSRRLSLDGVETARRRGPPRGSREIPGEHGPHPRAPCIGKRAGTVSHPAASEKERVAALLCKPSMAIYSG